MQSQVRWLEKLEAKTYLGAERPYPIAEQSEVVKEATFPGGSTVPQRQRLLGEDVSQ